MMRRVTKGRESSRNVGREHIPGCPIEGRGILVDQAQPEQSTKLKLGAEIPFLLSRCVYPGESLIHTVGLELLGAP